ncbi:MAG TPA: divalent-cation tolerance protein CutA [Terriglobales bacterium]|jgi:periplasmic divalent cation tolerance protein
MTDKILVISSAGSTRDAGNIANTLVEMRLAACVNILPQVASVYRWQGRVDRAEEWLLLIKTTRASFAAVRDKIKELHSYEIPECIAIPIEAGSEDYLKWIGESVG